jgi:hypothetical protein
MSNLFFIFLIFFLQVCHTNLNWVGSFLFFNFSFGIKIYNLAMNFSFTLKLVGRILTLFFRLRKKSTIVLSIFSRKLLVSSCILDFNL